MSNRRTWWTSELGMKFLRCAVVAIALLALTRPSTADNKIVIESFTGGKSDQTAEQLRPLLEALANRGFVGGYEALGRTFEARVSRPPIGKGLPADFAAQADAGHRAWIAGKFEDAVKLLTPLVDNAHANAGAFAKDQDAREALAKALIALALSHQRRGDPDSMKLAFDELLRSFPTMMLSRATYGPDAVTAFEDAKKALGAKGRGKLTVRSNVDNAVIYINEKIEAAGTVTKENLLPGDYRVFAQLPGKQLSRVHRVSVKANEVASVTIDAAFDQVVQTSPTWTGLSFATAADREKSEIRHAAMFGNAVEASAVAVVGIDQVRGHSAIVGILVDRISGTEIRRASVALEPDPGEPRMNALAQFLAGENLAPAGIDVATTQPRVTSRGGGSSGLPVDRPSHGWGGWKFVTGGLAIGALGVGGFLLQRDGTCQTVQPAGVVCPDLYNTATPAYLTLGGGVVLASVTVYLFVRGGKKPTKTAFVVPVSGGAVAAFATRF